MFTRKSSEHGSALVEFVLCFSLFWVPLFFGMLVIGFNLIRAIQVTQVCRDAAHMYAYGTDFSQPAYKNLLVSLATGLNMKTTGGNGVIIFSTITFVDQASCDAANLTSGCSNLDKAVFVRRIVIGDANLHTSAFGTPAPNIVDSSGNINNIDYLKNASVVAENFKDVIGLKSSTQFAFVAEMWVNSPDYNWWSGFGNSGASARAIF